MTRRLKLGVVGLSRAFTLMLPTLAWHQRVQLVACADPRPEARARFAQDFRGSRGYADAAALCADPEVEAVYIATPHQFHAADVLAACAAGLHCLVEKPMAVTLEDCAAMVEAAARAGVQLVIGHSHSQDGPVLAARRLIASGAHGRLRMMTALTFTDFLYRPRRPEELVTEQGGGVVFSQGAHQIDIVRLLGGGLLRSLRAQTFGFDPARPTEGAYAALLSFADGATATLTYSGHGRYDSDELMGWIGEMGQRRDPESYGTARRALAALTDETAAKARRAYGPDTPPLPNPAPPAFHNQFGFLLACCEGADLRLTAEGVLVHADDRRWLHKAPLPEVPRGEVLDEFCAAVLDGVAPLHTGAWGMATLEACLALLHSARTGQEVTLRHQVATGD
ncbi:Gfo/Idh/MocA family protein [Roseomonas sp. AR75]|uniref:Gfo/Idh/MocA family protein n=1 Tax=Roseomonas sp. AR75 TaxID=2562311 RepID=UPI001F0F4A25|nr:Gfo/Idh/MocA family oxidoreductase [Roseomonas sp. AR75]